METLSPPASSPSRRTINDRLLDGLARMILNRHDPKSPWRKLLFLCKLGIYAINALYLGALVFAMFGMNIIGERNLAFAILLFAPPWFWLIPLAVLIPFCILTLRWKLVLVHLLTIAGFLLVYMDFEWRLGLPKVPDDGLVIMTYNRGQHQNQSLRPYIGVHDPDFVCMQEAASRAGRYERAKDYEAYEARNAGEFLLLSKFPILEEGLIQVPRLENPERKSTYGAWFTVDWNGQILVIYQVHTLSPRDQLSMDPRPIVLGLMALPPFSPVRERHDARHGYWRQRIAEMEHFREILLKETRPFFVVGDFNMVDRGYLYDLLPSTLQDTHEKAGFGYGYTFPGTGGGLPTFYEPWVRIDYIFAGPTWKVLYNHTEPERPSQHRAVAAGIRPRGR